MTDKIALIPIKGPISSGGQAMIPLQLGSDMPKMVREMLERAKNNDVKGIVFEIDSPGGTPYPTKEIVQAIKGLDIPTVAQIKEKGLSGAYWIATACDKIVADELSWVGGIGVAALQPDFSKLMDKLGIKLDSSSTGKYKEQGLPFGGKDKDKLMEEHIQEVNKIFAESVSKSRDLDEEAAEDIFEGKPYLGRQAKKVGLIDLLGGRNEAVKECMRLMNVKEADLMDYGEEIKGDSKGFFGSMLKHFFDG